MNLQPVETFVELGEIGEAITALMPITQNTHLATTVQQLQSRHNGIRTEIQKGIIKGDEARLEKNKISAALLEIVNQLKKNQGIESVAAGSQVSVKGNNNHVYVGIKDSTIRHTTQNHSGSGDNVAGDKHVGK